MGSADSNALAAALDRMWARFLPEMIERVSVLEAAAASLSAGHRDLLQMEAAAAAAHKLAGVLGTFGLAQGTILARELEKLYSADAQGPAQSLSERLLSLTSELRTVIESRR